MKMNLPNKLTLARVIMVPFFVAALLYREGDSTPARMRVSPIFWTAILPENISSLQISENSWIRSQTNSWSVRPSFVLSA